jgi:hypothetical protein
MKLIPIFLPYWFDLYFALILIDSVTGSSRDPLAKDALIPVVNSNGMTAMVSVLVENDIYIIIHHHLSFKWHLCVQHYTDSATYIMIMYSHLVEGSHKTFLAPHVLGVWSWPVA